MHETRVTIKRETTGETEVKGSRFLAFLMPYENFSSRLDELRRDHRKANHHVTAFRHLDADDRLVEGCKDDGEPGGTAGMPILKVLQGSNLVDCGLIIVRYFGGTKLGTGGLARAYADAAKVAVESASTIVWRKECEKQFSIDFSDIDRFQKAVENAGLQVTERQFVETGVKLRVAGETVELEVLQMQFPQDP